LQERKIQKIIEEKAKLVPELRRLRADYEKTRNVRKLMQEKLKKIYMNSQKSQAPAYRDQQNSFSSRSVSGTNSFRTGSTSGAPETRSPFSSISGFFSDEAPMMKQLRLSSNSQCRSFRENVPSPILSRVPDRHFQSGRNSTAAVAIMGAIGRSQLNKSTPSYRDFSVDSRSPLQPLNSNSYRKLF
jgi:hypothetical protein